MIGRRARASISARWRTYSQQGVLFAWSFAANFSVGTTLYLTRETGLLQWALEAQQLEPGVSTSAFLIGGGVAFGSVVLAITGRFTDRLRPSIQPYLHLGVAIWTSYFFVRPNAIAWLSEDATYEAYASTWFFTGWAITQFAAAWLLVDSEDDDAATSSA